MHTFLLTKRPDQSLAFSAITPRWHWLLMLLALLLNGPDSAWAQTLINETFETGNSFTVVNGTQTNKWFVSTVAGNGPATTGTRAVYVSNDAAGVSYNYDNTSVSVVHMYQDVAIPAGQTTNLLSFDWKGVGESSFDYLRVYAVPTTTMPVAGTSLGTTGQVGSTFYNLQAPYTRTIIALPTAIAGTTVRLVFSWINDGSLGGPQPTALDNVSLFSRVAAPLSGVYTINNTQPTTGTNFNNFTDAIGSLNADGIAGAVTFNVSAGQTFAETPPAITATGTATNPIIFQKTTGTNPVVQVTGGAAGIEIAGGDFFTFTGIDVAAGATGPTYGYRIRNVSATNGAFNNTVQNASITLLRTTSTSGAGLIQTGSTTGGGVTATASSGVNQNNRYLNLTIRNAYNGIWLIGTSTSFADFNTEVANCAVGNPAVPGDIGNGNGTSATTAYGIRSMLQNQQSIHDNTVTNVYAATTVYGLSIEQSFGTGAAAGNVYNNKVSAVRNNSTSSTSTAYGARLDVATTSGPHTLNCSNNFISNITNGYATATATATRVIRGIYAQSAGSGSGSFINVQYNSVRIDGSGSSNGSNTCFEIGTSSGPVYDVRNNIFANFTTGQTSTSQGKHYTWISTSTTAIGPTGTVSDYNDLYVASGTGDAVRGYTGAQGTPATAAANVVDRATLTNWQAAPTKDVSSVAMDPLFVSATDLHTQAPGINNLATPIAGVLTDVDGQARGAGAAGSATGPDIGADEFTPPACVAATNLSTANITANSTDISFTPAASGSSYTVTYTPQGGTSVTFTSTAPGAPVTVTGLTSGTFYTVGVTTNCGGGATSATPTVSFTTLAGCAPVTSLATSGITTTSTNLTFTAGNGNTSYTVTYTPAGGTATTVTPSPTTSPIALTGLTPGTTYSATVQPLCSGGGTAAANTVSFTTLFPAPANDNCTNAVVLASATTCTATNGTVIGATQSLAPILCNGFSSSGPAQDVFYSFTATGTTHTLAVTGTFDGVLEVLSGACGATANMGCSDVTGNNETLTLTTLTTGTTYLVRYYPYFANPTAGTFSICVTNPAACAAPTAVAANTVTSTSANVTFTAGNGNTDYTVTYTPAGGTGQTATGTAAPIALTGLTPNTTYSVTVTGNCAAGATATSSPAMTFTTSAAPPANDQCSGAIALTCNQTVTGTTNGATTTGDPTGSCTTSVTSQPGVFYSFAGTGDIVKVSTCSGPTATTGDTKLFVYSGTCAALTCVGGNDDIGTGTGGCGTNGAASTVTFTSVAGTNYVIFVQGFSASLNFGLNLTCTAPPACAPVTGLTAANITTTSANVTFTAGNGNTSYTVTYAPSGGTAQTATGTASPIALSGLTPGTAYAVSVQPICSSGGTSAATTTSFTTLFPTPANDQCSGAITLNCGQTVTGTTNGATTTGDPTSACGTITPSVSPSVFYSYVGTGDIITASTCGAGTTIDTKLFVYSGTCAALTCVGSNDDDNACGANTLASTVSFPSVAGTTYYIMVQRFGAGNTGTFDLALTCAPAPPANLVVSSPQNVSGTYNNVTVQSGGIATLTGPLTVNGALTVQSGGILAQNCQTLTGPGSFALQTGAELRICAPAGIAAAGATGAIQLTGTRTYASDASYTYNGTTAQVTGSGLPGTVRNLTVNNATGLTLSQGVSIAQVARLQSGNLSTSGNGFTLLSSATGTALVDNTGGVVTGTGTMQRAVTNAVAGPAYRHFGSPVVSTTLADLNTTGFSPTFNTAYNSSATPGLVTTFPTVFGYDQSRITTVTSTYGPFDKGWFSPASASDVMQPTRGYTVNAPATATPIDFVGTFNNAAQPSGSLSRGTDAQAGWQLLGNPYPSPLDWSTVAAAQRPGMDGAMYVYQSTGQYAGTYRTYDNGVGGSPLIDAGSGYFARVTAPSSTGAVNLTNTNRITAFGAEPAFGRGTADTRARLHLQLTGAGLTDETYLYQEAGATAGVDAQYDAVKLANPAGMDLASLNGTTALAINGLPLPGTTDVVVPLTLRVPQGGSFGFEVTGLTNFGTATVYLRDALTGTQQLLQPGTRYSFTLATTTAGNGRFSLIFRAANVTATRAELTAATVSIYPNPAHGHFTVLLPPLASQHIVQATLLNVLGQVVLTRSINLTAAGATAYFNTQPLAKGIYILRLQAQNQVLSKSVVVE